MHPPPPPLARSPAHTPVRARPPSLPPCLGPLGHAGLRSFTRFHVLVSRTQPHPPWSWGRCGSVLAQMWFGPGADVVRSWRRCGRAAQGCRFRSGLPIRQPPWEPLAAASDCCILGARVERARAKEAEAAYNARPSPERARCFSRVLTTVKGTDNDVKGTDSAVEGTGGNQASRSHEIANQSLNRQPKCPASDPPR